MREVQVEIADNPDAGRWELLHDGELVGVVDYHRAAEGGVVVIPHVEVLPRLRGRGHSEPFLDYVLHRMDEQGLKVIPMCGYVVGHFRVHPELRNLLAHG